MVRSGSRLASPKMTVSFFKLIEKRGSYWEASRGRTTIPGSMMALGRGDMPHDLIQFVVEAVAGMGDGFWGSIADGATFKSTGLKRTKPGRAVIAKNREGLGRAEVLAGTVHAEWLAGVDSPTSRALTRFDALWKALGDGDSITVSWPGLGTH